MLAATQQTSAWWTVIGVLITAFITGAMARFAVPGPDPMPAWLTIAIGLLASFIGYGIVIAVEGRHAKDFSWAGIVSFFAAIGLVVAYRHFVQKRALWGKDAYRFPERGIGVEQQRERLRNAGIDPDKIGVAPPFGLAQPGFPAQQPGAATNEHPGEPTENPAHYLGRLEELHDAGVLDDPEYEAARTRLLEKLR
ncbi:MAG: hypothetical protein QOG85_2132 [Gaiellaceae bacterium]|jgi:uncharacterized membrane protein YeaQ/YmgE (transglycosylase-associated protein family)|nr:hypothetical protein [Gaiellaceae bacterium]